MTRLTVSIGLLILAVLGENYTFTIHRVLDSNIVNKFLLFIFEKIEYRSER